MKNDQIALPIKQLLTIQDCPPGWHRFDLYLFQEAADSETATVFYVGQSENAFLRVWRHLEDGFKGRSLVGKLVRVNWPASMNFVVELIDSGCFDSAYRADPDQANHRTAVERRLIETLHPCLNTTWNERPAPLPARYKPPTASVRYPRHMGRMMREARVATERDSLKRSGNTEW
jgi:hypothetical protein